ncbi:MAG: OmpA family protein [Vibrio sp.]
MLILKKLTKIFIVSYAIWSYSINADEVEILQTNNHLYLGTKVGFAHFDDACDKGYSDCDDKAIGYGLYTGYQLSPWFALEAGFTNYSDIDASYPNGDVEAEIWTSDISAVFRYHLTNQWSLYTRLGGIYADIDKESEQGDSNYNGWALQGAAGLEYAFAQRWSTRLEYQYVDGLGEQSNVREADLSFISLGVTYHFGQSKPSIPTPPPIVPMPEPEYKKISLKLTSLFDIDSAKLKSTPELNEITNKLKKYTDGSILITGHTDSTGSDKYNQKLSEQRAETIAQYLEKQGIQSERITTQGFGETQPIAANTTKDGRKQNRRVEISYQTQLHIK